MKMINNLKPLMIFKNSPAQTSGRVLSPSLIVWFFVSLKRKQLHSQEHLVKVKITKQQ